MHTIRIVFIILLGFISAHPVQDQSDSLSQYNRGIQIDCGDIHSDLEYHLTSPTSLEDLPSPDDREVLHSPTSGVEQGCPVYRATVRSQHYAPYAEVSIGTPPRKFELVLNTVLSDVILPMRHPTVAAGIQIGHVIPFLNFRAAESSTYQNDSLSWTGNVTSYDFGSDIVSIANVSTRMAFSQGYNRCNGGVGYYIAAGCLGLNFHSLNRSSTFFEALNSTGKLPKPAFSLVLPNDERDTDGEILFGAIDHSRYNGSLAYAKVKAESYWYFFMSNITFNNHTVIAKQGGYVDISYWASLFPLSVAEAFYSQIQGASEKYLSWDKKSWRWSIPCHYMRCTDKVQFSMGGTTFSLPLKVLMHEYHERFNTWCETSIRGQNITDAVFGKRLLQNFYMVFDHGPTRRFGLALLRNSTLST